MGSGKLPTTFLKSPRSIRMESASLRQTVRVALRGGNAPDVRRKAAEPAALDNRLAQHAFAALLPNLNGALELHGTLRRRVKPNERSNPFRIVEPIGAQHLPMLIDAVPGHDPAVHFLALRAQHRGLVDDV